MRRSLLLLPLLLAACQPTASTPKLTGTGMDMFAPTAMRLHPLTRIVPAPPAPVANARIVLSGDSLQISVFELVTPGLEYVTEQKVDADGNITLVNIGKVHAAGLTPAQLESSISHLAVDRGRLLGDPNTPGPEVHVTFVQATPTLEARIEFTDQFGDTTKGPGTITLILYDQPNVLVHKGDRLATWNLPLNTPEIPPRPLGPHHPHLPLQTPPPPPPNLPSHKTLLEATLTLPNGSTLSDELELPAK